MTNIKTFNNCSDSELVLRYQKNSDPVVYGELYNRYYKKVYHFNLGKVKNRDAAFDITQDLFIKVSKKIFKLKVAITFPSWLFRIAFNDCMDYLRKASQNRLSLLSDNYDIIENESDLEFNAERDERVIKIARAMEEIPADIAELMVAKYVDGRSIKDLSDQYGISNSAVKMRLLRARKAIVAIA